jgi:hypothetical protein
VQLTCWNPLNVLRQPLEEKAVSHNHIEPRFAELANRFEKHLTSTAFKSTFLDRYGYSAICPMFI